MPALEEPFHDDQSEQKVPSLRSVRLKYGLLHRQESGVFLLSCFLLRKGEHHTSLALQVHLSSALFTNLPEAEH